MPDGKTYIVEHLDPELGPWSELEYVTIARETAAGGGGGGGVDGGPSTFCLSSLPLSLELPTSLTRDAGPEAGGGGSDTFRAETRGVEEMYASDQQKGRVCLLDPQAGRDLSPEDGAEFDVFLFGGILGDDPPRDRTSELRKKGFKGRRLGPVQMTTDTAVRVTRMVIEEQFAVDTIPYLDFPELKFNEHESTEMPFRYVKGKDGKPVMPDGMLELIKKDADKSIDDLF